ncbi:MULTISPECIES: PadR family transcriptional regulator [Thermomonosporaceae]|uniref:PadR family transcriptional regulator n=1 Tax=Thermomonosporaceae TaxID=2012 RepID=UPI00255B091C|nr:MULTISPECIES: PadR family transcriptional regulator [Thermomonosporaceae]MDL4771747.1 PadR family transcriptional regulator [Actinomadura xylanilytica]
MSIRHGLLALLSQGPRYGYQLRTEFESSTGATWPLNIGQVYSTLARLERDERVTRVGADDEGRFVYRITPDGEEEVRRWFATPIARTDRPRDELSIKLAMAVTTPGVDVVGVVQTQRTATLRSLQELTRLKADAPAVPAGQADRAWRLVLESMIFQAEAEARWLDHCEAYVVRADDAAPAERTDAAGGTGGTGGAAERPGSGVRARPDGAERARR